MKKIFKTILNVIALVIFSYVISYALYFVTSKISEIFNLDKVYFKYYDIIKIGLEIILYLVAMVVINNTVNNDNAKKMLQILIILSLIFSVGKFVYEYNDSLKFEEELDKMIEAMKNDDEYNKVIESTKLTRYRNSAFEVNVPAKYMGGDVVNNNSIYGLGIGGNFLFITEEDSSKDKIKKIKDVATEEIQTNNRYYGNDKLFYKLNKIEIDGRIAFTYESNKDEVKYYIPTDNYIISINILALDETSPYNNTEFMQIINDIEILDTVNNINYNKDSITILNWDFVLKCILRIVIVVAIIVGVIIFIKHKRKKNRDI